MLRSGCFLTSALIGLLSVAGCGGSGGGDDVVILPEDNTVELSGIYSADGTPLEGALVTPYAIGEPDAPMFTPKATDATGAYTIDVFADTPVSFEFSKLHFATLRTQYESFKENSTGLDFETLSVVDAKVIIDTAFGGMMLDLADMAWLAINVTDSTGVAVDGATITPNLAPAGGGALLCDGTFSGTSITIAPPCVPDRSGPMYLAYFYADVEISIAVSGSPTTISAPLRVGELTFIDVEQ